MPRTLENSAGPTSGEGGWVSPPSDEAPLADPMASPMGLLDGIHSGVKAWLDIGLTIGKDVKEAKGDLRRVWEALQRNTPVDYGVAASGIYPASGSLVLNLGSPDQGNRWEVTNVVVGGADQNVTAAGSAGLYVGGMLPTSGSLVGAPGLASMADQAKSLPNVGFYGTRQLVVNDQEYLFLIIFGGTPGQVYIANASMTVFNVAAAKGKVDTIV